MFNLAYLRSKTSAVVDDGWSFWQHHQQHPSEDSHVTRDTLLAQLSSLAAGGNPSALCAELCYTDPGGQRSELFWIMLDCSQQSAELWTPSLYLYIGTTSLLD